MWLQKYQSYIDSVVFRRQEHVHPRDSDGVRRPLTACRSRDKPDECKHGFPKDHLIATAPRLLCPALAKELGFKTSGRRNAVGSIEPPRQSGPPEVKRVPWDASTMFDQFLSDFF